MEQIPERVLRRIHKKPSGCHGWYGCTDSSGYPTTFRAGKNVKVHRWVFARANPGVELAGWTVLQTCLDKGCLNVEHMRRMRKPDADKLRNPAKGRSPLINWDLVHRIRRMPAGANMAQVARDHGIAESTARLIRNNQAWRQ